jgi:hypothetical protein
MNNEENKGSMSPELKDKIQGAVDTCIAKVEAGEYRNDNEAIDAVIADLEALKETEGMGGLGEEGPMDIPDESAGEEEAEK